MWHAYSAISLCLSGTGQAATRKDVSNHQRSNCSRLPWKQVHRHAYTLPQVTQTCGRVKLPRPRGWEHFSKSRVTPTVNSYPAHTC